MRSAAVAERHTPPRTRLGLWVRVTSPRDGPNDRVDLWRNLCTSLLLYFVLRVRCVRRKDYQNRTAKLLTLTLSLISWRSNTVVLPRCKESSRSLSHLLMSFLSLLEFSVRLTFLLFSENILHKRVAPEPLPSRNF